jgi:hypothetical protein
MNVHLWDYEPQQSQDKMAAYQWQEFLHALEQILPPLANDII